MACALRLSCKEAHFIELDEHTRLCLMCEWTHPELLDVKVGVIDVQDLVQGVVASEYIVVLRTIGFGVHESEVRIT